MNVAPYKNVKDALIDYISFMFNVNEYGCDSPDAEKTDRKRKALHDRILEAFGFSKDYRNREEVFTFSIENIVSGYEPVVDDSKNVEWLSKYVYDLIVDRLRKTDYDGIETHRRLKHFGLYNLEKKMKEYNEFLSECESVLNEWDSLKDKYNKAIFDSERKPEYKSFWHDVNGAKWAVRKCEKTMREFLSMPTDAYTKVAVEEYFDKPWDNIIERMKKIAYITINCKIYMKQFIEKNKEILENAK
jgi:hypothetical protein